MQPGLRSNQPDTKVTFRLIVTDNNGSNDIDDVTILIKNTTLPKVAGV